MRCFDNPDLFDSFGLPCRRMKPVGIANNRTYNDTMIKNTVK